MIRNAAGAYVRRTIKSIHQVHSVVVPPALQNQPRLELLTSTPRVVFRNARYATTTGRVLGIGVPKTGVSSASSKIRVILVMPSMQRTTAQKIHPSKRKSQVRTQVLMVLRIERHMRKRHSQLI